MGLIQSVFDFEFLSADTVRFVKMDFCDLNTTILHADSSAAFEFAPIAGAVFFAKTRQVMDTLAFGDCLDIGDLADDLKVHILNIIRDRRKTQVNKKERISNGGAWDLRPDR